MEQSLEEGRVMTMKEFKSPISYSSYLSSLIENAYNRGMDIDKSIKDVVSEVMKNERFLPMIQSYISTMIVRNNNLELARIYYHNMRTHDRGDVWICRVIVDWLYVERDRDTLADFVISLPGLNYTRIMECSLDYKSFVAEFILEIAANEIDYIKLMNNNRVTRSEIRNLLMKIIARQM